MTVLVAGSHGATGQLVVKKLAARGHTPRAMVRKESQSDVMRRIGGEPVVADLTGDVSHALDGCEAVIFAAGSDGDDVEGVDRDGAIRLIDACAERGTGRFVMLSAIGADEPSEGPEGLRDYLEAKHDADEHLRASGLPYTIVQPGALSDASEHGRVLAEETIGHQEGEIPRSDVAEALVLALQEPNTENRTVELLPGDTLIEDALRTF